MISEKANAQNRQNVGILVQVENQQNLRQNTSHLG